MKRLAVRAAACVLSAAADAQPWPTQAVRIVVPAPAGSSLDTVARTLGERLTLRWKQTVVVDNKPGADGLLGMDAVAKAAPDGHTLGVGFNGPIAFGPFLYRKMPYDPAKDLLPLVLTTSQPNVLAVAASNPAHSVPELVSWARTQGDKLSYGSVGNGSSSHLTMELFKSAAGFQAVHLPYSGSPPAVAAQINADVNGVLQEPAVRETFSRNGLMPGGGSADAFHQLIDAEGQRWGPLIRRAGITIE